MNNLINKNIEKFTKYYEYLVSENEKYNLTAITNKEEVFIKHFIDSISLIDVIDLENKKLLDVGSGAGFPSIPLKICIPSLEVTIIEPTQKRCNFMQNVIKMLGLEKITVINARAEDKAREYEEKFDVVVARAVTNLSNLSELLVRFCKIDGYIGAYKAEKAEQEIILCKNCFEKLGLKYEKMHSYILDESLGKRNIIMIKKQTKTSDKYPRRYDKIKKNPL